VLPGSRKSALKAQKWPGKKIDRKNVWPNFAKRGQRKVTNEVPYFTVMANSQRQNLILNLN
jgi:hypothetical protein